MIKSYFLLLIIFFYSTLAETRNTGETEITTEEGIEVFQNEKYYLLKKNVEIISDELELKADNVKIYFNKDLYDIEELIANNKVNFNSKKFGVEGKGENLKFNIKNQKIFLNGINSKLFFKNIKMISDKEIIVDNLKGEFLINGPNSKLISDQINISGEKIDGIFEIIEGERNISNLNVEDNKIIEIKTDDILMFAKIAIFNSEKSIIELFNNVEIHRGNQIITGDYGILDTNNNAYKVSSNKSNKVKALIGTNE